MLGEREEAEDLLHELFAALPDLWRSFRGESSVGTWLFRALHNRCLDQLRNRKNRRALLERWHIPLLSPARGLQAVSGTGAGHEEQDLVQRLLSLFPADQRAAFWLKEAEGWELPEIAEATGVPVGTLKSRLSRGRERMREALLEWGELSAATSMRPASPAILAPAASTAAVPTFLELNAEPQGDAP
jgi:RNA polymerase sigma-70 factor (ECF subfamily)